MSILPGSGRVEEAPELDEEDEKILDELWASVSEDEQE